METVERERYTDRQLEYQAREVYDEEVKALGMTFDALRVVKELDEVYYHELLEGLQEYVTYYICPECEEEYEDEDEALNCHPEDDEDEAEL